MSGTGFGSSAALTFLGAALTAMPSALEAAELPLSNANLKPGDWKRHEQGLPDFSKFSHLGRTVYIDPIASTNPPPTLAAQVVAGPSLRIGSAVPMVFERGTNLTNLSDSSIGTDLVASFSSSSEFFQGRTTLEPIAVYVTKAYDDAQAKLGPTPFTLIVAFPGYGSTAKDFLNNVNNWGLPNLVKLADEKGFLLAVIQRATVDSDGYNYFNATDACCDFNNKNRPDVTWTIAGINEIKKVLKVGEVLGLGISNGGHMVTQLAARQTESGVDAVATLSGRGPQANQMPPVGDVPVSLLFVNGTRDDVAAYGGGDFGIGPFPAVEQSVKIFADRYNLTNKTVLTNSLDILNPEGPDTTVIKYKASDLSTGGAEVELWKHGTGHNPDYTDKFPEMVVDWLLNHRRPASNSKP